MNIYHYTNLNYIYQNYYALTNTECLGAVAIEKGVFWSHSTTVANNLPQIILILCLYVVKGLQVLLVNTNYFIEQH